MARYNSALTSNTITGTATIGSPYSGAFTEFTGTAPYTVTLPTPLAFPGVTQTFYNATSGTVTLSTPSGNFVGTGGPGASTALVYSGNVVGIVSDGTNYVVISEDGSPLIATTGSFSSNVTINGGSATLSVTPSVVTMAPTASSTIDNIAVGATTRASGAFTTLTANNAVTFTANTASSSTTTGSLVVTGGIGASGTIYAGAFNGNLTGTLQTAAQPNITSTGSLTIPGLTVDTTTLVVDATNDRVGVGTAGPGAVLHVVKTVQQTDFDNANQVLQLENTSTDTSGNVSGLRFRQTNGTNAANSFIGLSSTGDSSTRANLIFASPNTSGNATIRMRVNAYGQVFIGTTSTPYSGATGTGVYINGVSNQQTDLASLFVSGAKIGFAGIQSLVQNQLTVYDSTAGNGAGTGGAIAFGGNAGSGQATFYAAIESRKDNATAGDYGASLNFYTRPTGGYYTSPNMTISSGGKVGIGTDNPVFLTEIVGGTTTVETTLLQIRSNAGGIGTGSTIALANSTNATAGSGRVELAAIRDTASGASFVIRTGDSAGTIQNRVKINESGNVGIGTDTIQSWTKLQINGTAGAQTGAKQQLYVVAPTATVGEGAGVRFSAASGGKEAVGIIGVVNNATGVSGSMTFHVYNAGGDIPEWMRITNTGNVGIGTTPTSKLTLNTGEILVGVNGSAGDTSLYLRGGASGDKARIKLNHYGTADYIIAVGDIAGKLSITKTLNGTDGIIIDSTGKVGIGYASPSETLSVFGNITAGNTGHEYRVRGRNQPRLIYTVTPSGSMYSTQAFVWSTLFDTIQSTTSHFDNGTGYMMFLTSSNGVHAYSWKADLRVGGTGYGATSNRYRVSNMTEVLPPWPGGCGPSAFSSIDNTGFTYLFNPCYESVAIWIIEYGV